MDLKARLAPFALLRCHLLLFGNDPGHDAIGMLTLQLYMMTALISTDVAALPLELSELCNIYNDRQTYRKYKTICNVLANANPSSNFDSIV